MLLYLIRHAEAEPLGGAIRQDFDRPLTPRGREQVAALAAALIRLDVVIDAVATSPLVRAYQTATELVARIDPAIRPVTCDELALGRLRPARLSEVLMELVPRGSRLPGRSVKAVAAVGHMPDLAAYLEWLIGAESGTVHLSKAAVACLEFKNGPERAAGTLRWLVPPAWFIAT